MYQHPVPRLGSSPPPHPLPPSHDPINFFIPQNSAENYHNLETSTIQGENWFWNGD